MGKEKPQNRFATSYQRMINKNKNNIDKGFFLERPRNFESKYTLDELKVIMENGSSSQLAEVSEHYYRSNGIYSRIIEHYATLIRYFYLIVPRAKGNRKVSQVEIMNRYKDSTALLELLEPEVYGPKFAREVLKSGCYYGMVDNLDGKTPVIFDLPRAYSRSEYRSEEGVDLVEFDLNFFYRFMGGLDRQSEIEGFPSSIQKAYRAYDEGVGPRWHCLTSEESIYFTLSDEIPFFVSAAADIKSLEEYKNLERTRDNQDLTRILVQKVPINGMDLVFETNEAESMHEGSVEMLRSVDGINILTTYTDTELLDLSEKNKTISNNLDKIEKSIFTNTGVSAQFFASEGNISLEKSEINDLSLMMVIGKQVELFFKRLLNNKLSTTKIDFDFTILPVTLYNQEDYITNSLKAASYGYSFLVPSAAMGIKQGTFADLKRFENEILGLTDLLSPLKMSSTQSGDEDDSKNGRPSLAPEDKDDKTIANETAQEN